MRDNLNEGVSKNLSEHGVRCDKELEVFGEGSVDATWWFELQAAARDEESQDHSRGSSERPRALKCPEEVCRDAESEGRS